MPVTTPAQLYTARLPGGGAAVMDTRTGRGRWQHLNTTAALLWHQLAEGVPLERALDNLIERFACQSADISIVRADLAGLYTPTSGTVTWDGTDIARSDPEQLWRRLAMLPQDFGRWPVTARENITLGQGDQDERSITAAAAAAGADIVLDALPDGLDTNLAPSWWGGRDLSGGQWQRIAAARAFYRNAPVLICDEPTSALDPLAEEAVYQRIQDLGQGRAVILISHRLGSTRCADRILVLDGGQITEEGTHDSLINRDGIYATMWQAQANTYATSSA